MTPPDAPPPTTSPTSPTSPTPDVRAAAVGPLRPYATNDARFAVPVGWADQSVHILAAPGADGTSECSVVIHRDQPAAGETLEAYVERQLANARATLPELRVLRQGTLALGGLPARDAELRWTAETGLLHQRQVHVLRQGRVLTVTATTPERLWTKHAPAVDALLASWHFPLTLVDPRGEPRGAPNAAPGAG